MDIWHQVARRSGRMRAELLSYRLVPFMSPRQHGGLVDSAAHGGSTARSITLWAAILLAGLAVLVAIVQSVAGVLLVGPDRADDGAFAVSTLTALNHASGWPLPRWSAAGDAGLGTPVFYFYPPGAYIVAAAVGALLPKLSAAAVLGVTMILFRAGDILTCALWLRRHVETRVAVAGGALYALTPYIAVFNPQIRFAFAETAASVVLPLVFLAADAGEGQPLRTIVWIAPAIALMTFVHLPTAVLAGGLIVVYAAMLAPDWIARARQLLAASLGVGLGLGLAGATLVPALLLLKDINPQFLSIPILRPEHGFLFRKVINNLTIKENLLLHLGLIVPVVAAGLGVPAALRLRGWPRAALVTLAIAIVLTLPISAPIWSLPLPLRRVQFPWRLLVSVSLLGTVLATLGLTELGAWAWRATLLAGVACAAVWIGLGVYRSDRGGSDFLRTQEALASPGANVMEYFRAVGGKSWLPFKNQGAAAMRRQANAISGCPQHRALVAKPIPGGMTFNVSGCTGPILLPQLYFPGWTAAVSTTKPAPDPATGLIRVTVPKGQQEIILRRSVTWQEKAGACVSAGFLILWMMLAAISDLALRPRRPRLAGS
jgi:hypothetical protein